MENSFHAVSSLSLCVTEKKKDLHCVKAVLCQYSFYNLERHVTMFYFCSFRRFSLYYTNAQQSGNNI